MKPHPGKDILNRLFDYSEGMLLCRMPNYTHTYGERVGCKTPGGYRQVSIKGSVYLEHRLIYTMHHGDIPAGSDIKHLNDNRSDNRIDNLVMVARSHSNKPMNSISQAYGYGTPNNLDNISPDSYPSFRENVEPWRKVDPQN